MATTLLLLAMCAFMVWAIVHTAARIGWYQDERDADAFLAALRPMPETYFGMQVVVTDRVPDDRIWIAASSCGVAEIVIVGPDTAAKMTKSAGCRL